MIPNLFIPYIFSHFCTLMLTSFLVLSDPKMSAHDSWSDSDSENESALTGVETAVELGIPNGEITSIEDLGDSMVSRIGGIPVRVNVLFVFKHPVLNLLISLFLMHTTISTILVLSVSRSFRNLRLHSIPRIAKFACRLRSC
jgi:hypothetical protein